MRSFAPGFLERHELTHGLASTLRLLGEFRGRQDMYRAQSPELLEGLRRRAMIESVESSTRLEGAVAAPDRVRDIVGGGQAPAQGDRSEQEIAGYRDALGTIHEYYPAMPVTPGVILQLHRELFGYLPSPGGAWKIADNSIAETLPDGSRVVLFQPVPAWQTPAAVDELCRGLAESLDRGAVDPLLAVAAFVFDFLCIHPFADGNGRMARLLTALLLHKVGFDAGRYVSLEGIVEETKDGYYDSLRKSSAGWHEGAHSLQPWWEYLLGVVLLTAYRQLNLRLAGGDSQGGNKAQLVERIVSSLPALFVYADIAVACPGVSRPTIMRVLRRLREQGQITCVSKGRKAVWRKV